MTTTNSRSGTDATAIDHLVGNCLLQAWNAPWVPNQHPATHEISEFLGRKPSKQLLLADGTPRSIVRRFRARAAKKGDNKASLPLVSFSRQNGFQVADPAEYKSEIARRVDAEHLGSSVFLEYRYNILIMAWSQPAAQQLATWLIVHLLGLRSGAWGSTKLTTNVTVEGVPAEVTAHLKVPAQLGADDLSVDTDDGRLQALSLELEVIGEVLDVRKKPEREINIIFEEPRAFF